MLLPQTIGSSSCAITIDKEFKYNLKESLLSLTSLNSSIVYNSWMCMLLHLASCNQRPELATLNMFIHISEATSLLDFYSVLSKHLIMQVRQIFSVMMTLKLKLEPVCWGCKGSDRIIDAIPDHNQTMSSKWSCFTTPKILSPGLDPYC